MYVIQGYYFFSLIFIFITGPFNWMIRMTLLLSPLLRGSFYDRVVFPFWKYFFLNIYPPLLKNGKLQNVQLGYFF